jgi:peptide/nickel transport system permease protein
LGVYLIRRLAQSLVVMLGISLAAFLMIHIVPGDPARAILGPHTSKAAVLAMDHELGLDRSLPAQFGSFVYNALHLNFGRSTHEQTSVASLLLPRLGATLLLTVYATLISLLVAIPLATISAYRKNKLADHAIRLVTMVTFAMPLFWLGLVLILLFALRVQVFPTSGYGTGLFGHLWSLTLPALALGLGLAPLILRTLRGAMIETLGSEYVEAARARGLSELRILRRYTMRNALLAPITVLGINVSYLLGVVVVVENVFVLPGLGSLLVTSVQDRDFPVVQATALVLGAIVVAVNLATDIIYPTIDPRIRVSVSQ